MEPLWGRAVLAEADHLGWALTVHTVLSSVFSAPRSWLRCDPPRSAPAVCCHGSSTMMDASSGTVRWNKPFLPQASFRCGVFHRSRKEKQKNTQAGVVSACACWSGMRMRIWSGVCMRMSIWGNALRVKKMQELGDCYRTEKCLLLPLSFLHSFYFLPLSFFLPFKSQQFLDCPQSVAVQRFADSVRTCRACWYAGHSCRQMMRHRKVMGEWGRWQLWPEYNICMCTNITIKEGKCCRETRFL